MKISQLNKQTIKYSMMIGTFYASAMAIFDYFDGADFNYWKFIFHLVFFGLIMGLIFRPTLRNKLNEVEAKK